MKKIVLSLAGVMAAATFAPEASAIPSFARQTGRACTACHQQHFPVLNAVGQDFKNSGYTQIGTKGKFKGEDLSIPDALNTSILLKARYQKTNGTDAANTVAGDTSTNGGQWQIPDEISLFFGGRIGENEMFKIGFMNENNMTSGDGLLAGFKIPVVVTAVESVNVMVIPYITDALGQAYGYEQSSTGMTRGVRWAEHRSEISAAQYTGLGSGTASGIAFVAQTDMGYVNFSRWAPQFAYIGGSSKAAGTGVAMSSTWLRVAATPTVADWALHVAYGVASGSNYCSRTGAVLTADDGSTSNAIDPVADACDTKGSVLDAQAFGEVAGMETSVYFQTSTAPKSSATKANSFNSSTTNDVKATTFGADLSVIPHTLHVGAAIRKATNKTGKQDDAVTFTAVYDLFQNVALHANYSMYSGPAYDVTGAKNSLFTGMLEAAW